ncbi:MAG: STAS domain-containing protein [Polyangia bacterium]
MSAPQPPNPSDETNRPAAWHELVEAAILELHHAESGADLLRALAAPAMASGARSGVFGLWEAAASPASEELRTVASFGVEEGPELELGRVPAGELARAGWSAAAGSAVVAVADVGDVAAAAGLGEALRQLLAKMGARAVLVLPLRAGARGTGLVLIGWAEPTAFAEELVAAYRLLLRPAGWALRTCLLLASAERAHGERARAQPPTDRAVFETLLQHVPVGVALIDAPSRRVLWRSRLVEQLFPLAPGDVRADVLDHELLVLHPPGSREPPQPEDTPVGRALRTGQAVAGTSEAAHPERGLLTLETLAVPVHDRDPEGGTRGVLLFLQDVTERQRREQEQMRLQDTLIADQAAMLAERSMPLIPLSDEVLIMPIIGSVDAARAEQMMDSLLQGVSTRPCRFAILDITGVNVVDSHAAGALLRASQALRLLGVEPVLTGIRAEVAQTLVKLGIDLAALTTCSTVQAGIAYTTRGRTKR